jgi:hypothetical protein
LVQHAHHSVNEVARELIRGKAWVPLSDAQKLELEKELIESPSEEKKDFKERSEKQRLTGSDIPRLGFGRDSGGRLSMNDCYYHTEFVGAIRNLLPEGIKESSEQQKNVVLVVTGRTIGEPESRGMVKGIHLRGGYMSGNIALISTEGLLKAPAYPGEVQIAVERDARTGDGLYDIRDDERHTRFREALCSGKRSYEAYLAAYADKILQPHDPRLTEAIRGLTLQTLLVAAGETGPRVAMCTTSGHEPNPNVHCRCHDAHLSEEVIQTQIKKPEEAEFCGWHMELFTQLQGFKKN